MSATRGVTRKEALEYAAVGLGRVAVRSQSNAIKHSPRTAAVVLTLESTTLTTREAAKIVISDQGPGVQPELLPRIFDRFVAGERSTGLGLGLYLARSIVVAHGCTIDMHSVVGQGTSGVRFLPRVGRGVSISTTR